MVLAALRVGLLLQDRCVRRILARMDEALIARGQLAAMGCAELRLIATNRCLLALEPRSFGMRQLAGTCAGIDAALLIDLASVDRRGGLRGTGGDDEAAQREGEKGILHGDTPRRRTRRRGGSTMRLPRSSTIARAPCHYSDK